MIVYFANSRELGEDELGQRVAVLQADYSVDCTTDEHGSFRLLAGAVAVFFSAGVPVALMVMMSWRTRQLSTQTDADRFVARRIAEELKLDDRAAVDAINDVRMGTDYSFLVSAFHPRYFYWEGEMAWAVLLARLWEKSVVHAN